jgi:aarF domain-containing kinase
MSLLARTIATLEGIALIGDPSYAMVSQAYPFVVRKVLRNDTLSLAAVLRDILFGADGKLKPTRLSTLLNAALGFVAESQGGFIDFDAVPEEGASTEEIVAFLLSKASPCLHVARMPCRVCRIANLQ